MYSEVNLALISLTPVGIVHFNCVFTYRFKRINVYMPQAQGDLFLSAWSICKWARLCKRNREDCLKGFPVGILRTQAGLSSLDSRGYSKKCTAVALRIPDVCSQLSIKWLRCHPLSANKTTWLTQIIRVLTFWSCKPNSAFAATFSGSLKTWLQGLFSCRA